MAAVRTEAQAEAAGGAQENQCWLDLCEALQREAEAMGGFGRMTVEVVFHGGAPQELHVRERVPRYRLGGGKPPLTGRGPVG